MIEFLQNSQTALASARHPADSKGDSTYAWNQQFQMRAPTVIEGSPSSLNPQRSYRLGNTESPLQGLELLCTAIEAVEWEGFMQSHDNLVNRPGKSSRNGGCKRKFAYLPEGRSRFKAQCESVVRCQGRKRNLVMRELREHKSLMLSGDIESNPGWDNEAEVAEAGGFYGFCKDVWRHTPDCYELLLELGLVAEFYRRMGFKALALYLVPRVWRRRVMAVGTVISLSAPSLTALVRTVVFMVGSYNPYGNGQPKGSKVVKTGQKNKKPATSAAKGKEPLHKTDKKEKGKKKVCKKCNGEYPDWDKLKAHLAEAHPYQQKDGNTVVDVAASPAPVAEVKKAEIAISMTAKLTKAIVEDAALERAKIDYIRAKDEHITIRREHDMSLCRSVLLREIKVYPEKGNVKSGAMTHAEFLHSKSVEENGIKGSVLSNYKESAVRSESTPWQDLKHAIAIDGLHSLVNYYGACEFNPDHVLLVGDPEVVRVREVDPLVQFSNVASACIGEFVSGIQLITPPPVAVAARTVGSFIGSMFHKLDMAVGSLVPNRPLSVTLNTPDYQMVDGVVKKAPSVEPAKVLLIESSESSDDELAMLAEPELLINSSLSESESDSSTIELNPKSLDHNPFDVLSSLEEDDDTSELDLCGDLDSDEIEDLISTLGSKPSEPNVTVVAASKPASLTPVEKPSPVAKAEKPVDSDSSIPTKTPTISMSGADSTATPPPSAGVPQVPIGPSTLPPPNQSSGGKNRVNLLRHLMTPNAHGTGRVLLSTMPKSCWPLYLRQSHGSVRPTYVARTLDFFGYWDPYELVNKVELVAYPYHSTTSVSGKPWRDVGHQDRDTLVMHYQPMIEVTYECGGVKRLKADVSDLLLSSTVARFVGLDMRPGLEEIGSYQYFSRVEHEYDPQLGLIFKPILVSAYLFDELYTRRPILTPKMDAKATVERLIRFGSEDEQTCAHSDIYVGYGVNVIQHTISFLIGVVSGDMRTPVKDF